MLDLRRLVGQTIVCSRTYDSQGNPALIHIQVSNIQKGQAGITITSPYAEVDGFIVAHKHTYYQKFRMGSRVTIKSFDKYGDPLEFIMMLTNIDRKEAILSFHAPKDIAINRTEKARKS